MAQVLPSEPSLEHSYGIVPIRLIQPSPGDALASTFQPATLSTLTTEVLLVKQRSLNTATGMRWTFPKGHSESGDASTLHTALRELVEEVGLVIKEDGILFRNADGLIERYRNTQKGWVKEVRYWVGLVDGHGELVVQEKEISKARWMSFEEALDLVTFEVTREVLLRAMELLDGGKNGL